MARSRLTCCRKGAQKRVKARVGARRCIRAGAILRYYHESTNPIEGKFAALKSTALASLHSSASSILYASLTCSSAARSSCAHTSMPDPLGAALPDIVPLGLYISPSSVTLCMLMLQANMTACMVAASLQISVLLNMKAIASATSPG